MFTRLKSISFEILSQVCHRISGSGIGRLPGVAKFYDFIFQHLWLNKETVEIQGSHMYVNPCGLPECYKRAFRDYIMIDWEKTTTEKFKEVVRQGDVILDLGANMGFFTLLAARLTGHQGRVYSFEPNPTNYGLLLKNLEINGYSNVTVIQKAISNHTGTEKLYISDEDIGNSTIYEMTTNFMKSIGYKGILDIGYRYDRRDGKYKVLDINPRIGSTFRHFLSISPDLKYHLSF